jgi:hypothetical protein
MCTRRFAFIGLLVIMAMAFAKPSFANHITSATGTISCTNYALTFSYTDLSVGTSYITNYSFTINSTLEPTVTITGSNTFVATSSSQTVTVPVTALGPLAGNITISAASAILTSSNETVAITFDHTSFTCSTGTGRFTGGGKDIGANGVAITQGLELDCDLNPSNNLEINWASGHRFHMLHFVSAVCLDDPTIRQQPPVAPLDTMIGVGTGRYDGVDGYTVEFTLIDAGEPGRNDKIAILIHKTAAPGTVVLSLPLTVLTGGNLQAHPDQH